MKARGLFAREDAPLPPQWDDLGRGWGDGEVQVAIQ
jgi:hypothetical protein